MTSYSTYLNYNNPIHIVWRDGSPEDPFIERMDINKVVNQRIALSEIPDEYYRVRIADMVELNHREYIDKILNPNNYYVDYANGFIYFHESKEAATISAYYKGRGVILYPDTRIVHYDGTGSTESLHQIIVDSKQQVENLINSTEVFNEVLERMVISTDLTIEATNRSNIATRKTEEATKRADEAYNSTMLVYQPFVQKQADIVKTYPNPKVGWTVQVYENGVRYRWNGASWIPIDSFGGNIAIANETIDGLLSKELFKKVTDISSSVDTRVIVFVIPQELLDGVQDPHVQFPFEGEVTEISAFVSGSGNTETGITIEKGESTNEWLSLTQAPIRINPLENWDNKRHVISNPLVTPNSIFRLIINGADGSVKNLSVNVRINIK